MSDERWRVLISLIEVLGHQIRISIYGNDERVIRESWKWADRCAAAKEVK